MIFYLTTLDFVRFWIDKVHNVKENKSDAQTVSAMEVRKHFDFLCWNYVLNGLHDLLHHVYSNLKIARELLESFDHKYKGEDAEVKKFVIDRFLDYKVVDSKTVLS